MELPYHEKDFENWIRVEIKKYMEDPRTYQLHFR